MDKKNTAFLSGALFALVVLFFTGCTVKPENVASPSVKIDFAIQDNKEVYTVHFSGGIRNENNSVAFLNMKGTIRLIDPETKKAVDSFPFEVPVILPFDTGILDLQVVRTDAEIGPLLDLLKINREQLVSEGSSSGNFIEENDLVLTDLGYEKKNIITLLQEKK
ncbi:MAG: hypothetical protein CVV44_12625 [Spirochaetae bacterium HGW-Spirochaetae-1]|jgi:hypothetical protein|nr:MAG: hypothetical protein CVV44_12625 [Spirochaetae bacterium HGW-Spirochaetae-1]